VSFDHLIGGGEQRPRDVQAKRPGGLADGRREVLGMDIGPSEAETFWTAFLRKLTRRGLRGVSGASGSCNKTLPRPVHSTPAVAFDTPRALLRTSLCQLSNRSAARQNGNWKMATRDLRPKTADPGHETGNIGARDSRPSA
jgi:hypothetical protein